MQKWRIFIGLFSTVILTSCSGFPRMINYPFDPRGRGLNSPFEERNAQITEKFIIFTSDRRGSQDIYLFDRVNRILIDLPGLNALDLLSSHPSISQDGQYIVFEGSRKGRTGIYLYDRETRQLRNLTETLESQVRNPIISANGNRIAFESSARGQWDILVCDRSGRLLPIPFEP